MPLTDGQQAAASINANGIHLWTAHVSKDEVASGDGGSRLACTWPLGVVKVEGPVAAESAHCTCPTLLLPPVYGSFAALLPYLYVVLGILFGFVALWWCAWLCRDEDDPSRQHDAALLHDRLIGGLADEDGDARTDGSVVATSVL